METLTTVAPQQCSPSKQEYRGGPFWYVDGHYVGHDGFVVPKDFAEFHDRFPKYIRSWVYKQAGRLSSKEDIDDWTQDLCAHMSSLPARSKYRKAGKQDVIQTFEPSRHFGANLSRFLNYVNRCLANKFRTIHSKSMKNPISHAVPLFSCYGGEMEYADEGFQNVLLKRLKLSDSSSRKQIDDKLLIAQFLQFVRAENASLLPVLAAMTGTHSEAARKLRVTGEDVGRLYRQIRELGRPFLRNTQQTRRTQRSVRQHRTNMAIPDCIPSPARLSVHLNSTYWNRTDLYNEVWHQPLVKLSRRYGISDARLGKVCSKLRIPHPGRGYWAKRAVGQVVEQGPLPEFKEAPPVARRLRKTRSRGI